MTTKTPPYRLLPSIDRLVRLQADVTPELAKEAARLLVAELRAQMARAWPPSAGEEAVLGEAALLDRLRLLRTSLTGSFHRRVINATGVLLHTGLGRAPLPDAAVAAMQAVSRQGYVEVQPEDGKRGRRERAVAKHLSALTGMESAMIVNNNAAATLLALDAVARGGEVVVSRGELVEIGGGFRMPDVMRQAGCKLVEVGATNRTKPVDYERAIGEDTKCLLKVHPSNYRIEGFTEEVSLPELVEIGRRHGVPVVEDLGSGWMLDEPLPHDPREPSVLQSARSGADLICFSGDKLFGSVQAGILIGTSEWIGVVAQHPLYRALRLSKIGLAALEATLHIYRFGDPKSDVPVLRAVFRSTEELEADALALVGKLAGLEAHGYEARAATSKAYLGSGASPARAIESIAVNLVPNDPRIRVEDFAARLRMHDPAVFPRIEDDSLVIDMRSLGPGDWQEVADVLSKVAAAE